ncbi:MAG: hypothetical protein ACKOWF_07585 [Chloroflexota bacterium]
MTATSSRQAAPARSSASPEPLSPRRWGCTPHGAGWSVLLPGLGEVHVARLGWANARNDAGGADALNFLAALQGEVWGMPPDEWVPANILAILPDTGGSVLAAYRAGAGWNAEGWLGFALAAGSSSGVLVSHMLGVRADLRGSHDLGWLLKAIQGYEALRTGHTTAVWTFDPMRGANARLNLEKLGATVSLLTLDKYGAIRSDLYGDVPSDRFTARWDLTADATARRLAAVHEGAYRPPSAEETAHLPEAAPGAEEPMLRFAIPGDIDRLSREDPAAAMAWRRAMRRVVGSLLDTADALPGTPPSDPALTRHFTSSNRYTITGFASSAGEDGERRNAYILQRRGSAGES